MEVGGLRIVEVFDAIERANEFAAMRRRVITMQRLAHHIDRHTQGVAGSHRGHCVFRIVKTAQETFYGGYAGYFRDPDGNKLNAFIMT